VQLAAIEKLFTRSHEKAGEHSARSQARSQASDALRFTLDTADVDFLLERTHRSSKLHDAIIGAFQWVIAHASLFLVVLRHAPHRLIAKQLHRHVIGVMIQGTESF
jgi:hypothetical protein